MAKLIDAEELLQAMKKADEADPDLSTCWSRGSIRRIIEGLPTVDAVEVVRCKDCKHRSTWDAFAGCYWCNGIGKAPESFCSKGERRW